MSGRAKKFTVGMRPVVRHPPWYADPLAGKTAVPKIGWDALTVPGAGKNRVALAERFGTLPLTTLAQPAIDYARNGFPVSPLIGHLWQRGYNKLKDQPGFSACFAPEGRAPRVGGDLP